MGRVGPSLSRILRWPAAIAPLAFLAAFFWYPIFAILERGLGGGFSSISEVFGRRGIWGVIWFTVWQAAASTVLTVVIGLPIAGALARYRIKGRRIIRAFLTVPFVLPTVVVASAFASTFEVFGLAGGAVDLEHSIWAILLAHAFFNIAVVVRTVGAFWSGLDRRPEEVARTLGASRFGAFRLITLPQLGPAIAAASAIVFLFCFTSFGVILILGGPRMATIETEIFRYATQRIDFETAAVLALVQLISVIVLLVLTEALRKRSMPIATQAVVDQSRPPAGRRDLLGAGAALLGGLAFVLLPLVVLVERSLSTPSGYTLANFRALGSDDRVSALLVPPIETVGNSLFFAVLATAIAVGVGLPAALMVVYGRGGLGRLLDLAFTVPIGTSAVTLGFGMLLALDSPPLDLRSSWVIIPIAQGLVGIPFVLRSIVPMLRAIDPAVREAAATLGAEQSSVVREIDLPIAMRGVVVGASFAFAISLGEFGATSFLARPARPTVPIAIFRLLGQPGQANFGQAMALSVILVVLTAVAVLLIERTEPRAGVF